MPENNRSAPTETAWNCDSIETLVIIIMHQQAPFSCL